MAVTIQQESFPADRVMAKPGLPANGWTKFGVGLLALLISMTIAWVNLDQGWFHTDEGQLGQAAERVLNGELPHRDFDDMYTGALSYLNAFSFHLWGIDSHSMRWMLFVWFVPFVAAIYWLMTQFTKPWVAGVLTVLSAAWTIPMYSASMPSWYNLFFATWALCAMMKFLEQGAKRYLLLAGLAIGISICFKVSGLFILAAALLLLLYRNQLQTEVTSERSQLFSGLVSVALVGASLLSFSFVNHADPLMQAVHFVIPFFAITMFVLINEWHSARGSFGKRCREVFFDVVPLTVGVAIPVLAFVAVYASQGAIGDLINGTLVLPKQRLKHTTFDFPRFDTLIMVVPLIVLCYPGILGNAFKRKREQALFVLAVATGIVLFAMRNTPVGFTVVFHSFRNIGPFLTIGNLLLIYKLRDRLTDLQRQQLFLATAVAFFASLIQFPFPVPIYFFYAAPLFLFTALMATRVQEWVPQKTLLAVAVFLLLFSCFRFHTPWPSLCMRAAYQAHPSIPLQMDRCRIRVDQRMAAVFNRLQAVVSQHTAEGETIFSTPDAPEMSYLTGRRAMNGVMYEFFHDQLYDDLEALQQQLDREQVNLVVIHETPHFSEGVTDEFRQVVLADFDVIEVIEISWSDDLDPLPMYTIYKRRSPQQIVGK
jgi:hypothetical protein